MLRQLHRANQDLFLQLAHRVRFHNRRLHHRQLGLRLQEWFLHLCLLSHLRALLLELLIKLRQGRPVVVLVEATKQVPLLQLLALKQLSLKQKHLFD
jgi:hypothetical protein